MASYQCRQLRAAGPLFFLLMIFVLAFSNSAFAENMDKTSSEHGKVYMKVIDNTELQETQFSCDTYEVTSYNYIFDETVVEVVGHPILAAVAYCPSVETRTYSETRIFSSVSDKVYDSDKSAIEWYATASCVEDRDSFPQSFPAVKVILFCWDVEDTENFPGVAREYF